MALSLIMLRKTINMTSNMTSHKKKKNECCVLGLWNLGIIAPGKRKLGWSDSKNPLLSC